MGGCVGKPKEFNAEEAPMEAPAIEKVDAETIQEAKHDGDDKKDEALVDSSEPVPEPPKAEEAKTDEAETKPVEEKAEAVEEAPKEEEAKNVADKA